MRTDRRRTLAAEVAERHDCGTERRRDFARCERRARPVEHRRQRLASKPAVRRRLVPAHAANRIVGAAFRVAAVDPRGGPGPAGGVAEAGGPRVQPLPVLPAVVAARIDEHLECPVRDFRSVDPVRVHRHQGVGVEPAQVDRQAAAGNPHEPVVGARRQDGRLQREPAGEVAREINGNETLFLDPEADDAARQAHVLQGPRPRWCHSPPTSEYSL